MNEKVTASGFPADAWDLLSPQLTDSRREKMLKVASQRTNHVRLLLQDIHDPHNISACLRSAEAFGVLNIDQINLYQKFSKPSTVSRGSYNWLKLNRFTDIAGSLASLKSAGYQIAAGYPDATMKLDDIPVDRPIALLFGNEHRGVHQDWDDDIDYRFTIPMTGMVESLNISVSAALAMYTLTQKAKRELPPDQFYLDATCRNHLLSDWVCRQFPRFEMQLERLR